ncbi:MAG: mannonate dehydratase [Chitinophagales bacterium]
MNQTFALQQMMRWYGPSDPVQLKHIAQAGCSGVVSALHHVPVGEIWTVKDIKAYKNNIKKANLSWTVVESLPVHEGIKIQSGNYETYLENYRQSLKNLAKCGIEVVTYNFMPVLDWVRTNIAFQLPNKSEALYFNKADYAIFDLFLLKRPRAENDYTSEELKRYTAHFNSLKKKQKKRIYHNVLLGLPGSDIPFTIPQVLELLQKYADINRVQLKKNLVAFLEEVTPTAEEVGIKLAIHPDDPPYSVLGLPRIMSTDQDVADIMTAVPSPANGLCFCTGSFGARADNNLVEMVKKWGSRIYFLHFRNTKRDENGNFMEANHLEGDADMYDILTETVKLMYKEQRNIPMRPDHGHKMLDDLNKKTYPGYSAIGRLKGLAELRGLEYGIQKMLSQIVENH